MNKVLLYGGLGNQMFQYALNLALNEKGIKSRVSISEYFGHVHHNGFAMSHAFNLQLPFPVNVQNFLLKNGGLVFENRLSYFFLRQLLKVRRKSAALYREKKEFIRDENVFSQRQATLMGTWQAESYFDDIENVVRDNFVFKKPADRKNIALSVEISERNAVSIHIRRGDYLNPIWAGSHMVIKDKVYFENAIELIENSTDSPHFYIFSDDMIWVKDNIRITNCTYVDHNSGRNSYLDMYLMSLCKHNIISNSTFSWWGAWLNRNPSKIVVMPDRWLQNDAAQGIFPSEWVRLEV
ncbi:Glycosyl transferase family 11 [Dyadobacter koreensis]|uniref:Glycosyl transferase family 11 n=1 Tax=Dyadobacter koreensis TaxID=408657 RepID=A0A1H6QK16_9BACT|nr:alpha-1,2-fucosyltransferase [Dyadobacter koreensis]SEI40467.1 Glycosyl transferase family 11 [Dyadobacter koreensis]